MMRIICDQNIQDNGLLLVELLVPSDKEATQTHIEANQTKGKVG